MLYREIIAVCSEIHTEHINTAVWAERKSFWMLNFVVRIVTTGLYSVQISSLLRTISDVCQSPRLFTCSHLPQFAYIEKRYQK